MLGAEIEQQDSGENAAHYKTKDVEIANSFPWGRWQNPHFEGAGRSPTVRELAEARPWGRDPDSSAQSQRIPDPLTANNSAKRFSLEERWQAHRRRSQPALVPMQIPWPTLAGKNRSARG